jgi:hypothetical protein
MAIDPEVYFVPAFSALSQYLTVLKLNELHVRFQVFKIDGTGAGQDTVLRMRHHVLS